MTKEELYHNITEFKLAQTKRNIYYLKIASVFSGTPKWKIQNLDSELLTRDGQWVDEDFYSSSGKDEFMRLTRFDNIDEALEVWNSYAHAITN